MNLYTVLACLYLGLLPSWASANLTVSITDAPVAPGRSFTSTVVGGPAHLLNPCYQKIDCELRFYTIDESWLPIGREGYTTSDLIWRAAKPAAKYQYLDDWWRAVDDKTRRGSDYLPPSLGTRPCVVVAAGIANEMLPNTIVSNCARGIVQVPDCKILTPSLILDFGAIPISGEPQAQTAVSLQCSDTTARNLTIQTNTDELIPLGGSATLKAQLDWGAGYGKPGKIRIQGTHNLTLHGRLLGINTAQPGLFQGSAVVNISYE